MHGLPRFVVQRSLFHDFLAAYLPAVRSVRFGHPLAVEAPDDPPPDLDFGPLIAGAKVKELADQVDEAIAKGGIPLHVGSVTEGRFLPGQDTSAYLAPVAILTPPPSSPLFHAEPFGPVDTVVLVDTEAELLAAMNAGNGALVATISCDEEETARRLAEQVRAFKVGVNAPARAGTGRSSSAAWARRGGARSSAGNCWYGPSPGDPRGSACRGTSPTTRSSQAPHEPPGPRRSHRIRVSLPGPADLTGSA
nr:hypothetical protein GCM10020093_107150 [Planobispora longispora]